MITTSQVTSADIDILVPLFDAYRVFYKQASDFERARKFLTARILNQESIIFLARWDDSPCGFTQLYRTFSSVSTQHSWILNDLYVGPTFRGKGIGAALLNKAKEFAIQDNAKGLALETGNDNPAQQLYERLGWKQDKEYLHYFWKAE